MVVLLLYIIGYLIVRILHMDFTLLVWCTIVFIDMLFAFHCGKIIENLYKRVLSDDLTGVGNRNLFYLKFPSKINDVSQTSLLILDLDAFKSINDCYGHNVGDEVLIHFANILRGSTRPSDTIVRWGGEEFVIIIPRTEVQDAFVYAERIRCITEKSNFYSKINNSTIKFTVSIGIATGMENESAEDVVDRADKALYKAKEQRNLVVTWDHSMSKETVL